MLNVRKASLLITGSGLTAALIVGGIVPPASAADDHSSTVNNSASQVADAAGSRVVVDQTDGGQVRFDVNTAVVVDPRLEAVFSHVTVRDGETYLDFSAATAAGVDASYLNEFATGFASVGGKVTGRDAYAEPSAAPSRKIRSACVGRNRAWQEFLWVHVEIDSCKADELANAAGKDPMARRSLEEFCSSFPALAKSAAASLLS